MANGEYKTGSRVANKKAKQGKQRDRRNIWFLILTTLLVIGSIAMFYPPNERINQGLDIQGGLSVVLTAHSTDDSEITNEDMEASRSIIENRVNALGASEASVQVQGTNQILVQIPGLSDTETALSVIGKTGKLEFARLDSFTDSEAVSNITSGNYGQKSYISDENGNSFAINGPGTKLKVEDGTYTPIVTGDNIQMVTVDRASETGTDYAVNITLDSAGADAFYQASKDLVGNHGQIVIILDNEVQSAPAVQSEIPNGRVSITGNYTQDEAFSLKTVLESGSLPVSFEYSQSQVVGPTLGQEALYAGLIAALCGLALVMLYLLFFYKGLGILTAANMIIFAVMYLGLLATLSHFGLFTLSLAGLAGATITVGMAADSSVLTLERFREEIRMGRSIRAASISGVSHAIRTSIDADLVSMVSGLTLFLLAAASVKGFGLTLTLGIACDIVCMLLFKAPIIRLMAPRTIKKHPGFWNIADGQKASDTFAELGQTLGVEQNLAEAAEAMDPKATEELAVKYGGPAGQAVYDKVKKITGRFIKHDINFMGYRKYLLGFSACLIIISCLGVGIRGLDFGIEFVGGSSITFQQTGTAENTDQMREAFNKVGANDAVVQTVVENGNEGYLVRIGETDPQAAASVADDVAEALSISPENYQVTTIGPDWGESVINASLIAFLISVLLIIAFLAVRFEYKMGVAVVIALIHDLIIVVGVYAIIGHEVTPNVIAAILALLGYSCYDSVVSLHRIQDNVQSFKLKCSFMSMANHSLNQVFIRTINTTVTSLIPVIALLFFGGETLKDFALALVIGLIVGCYSSIAIATPIFSIWKEREERYAKLKRKFGETIGTFQFDRSERPAPPVYALETAAVEEPVEVAASTAETSDEKPATAPKPASSSGGGSSSNTQRRGKNKRNRRKR